LSADNGLPADKGCGSPCEISAVRLASYCVVQLLETRAEFPFNTRSARADVVVRDPAACCRFGVRFDTG
jgi:hypothetical protein